MSLPINKPGAQFQVNPCHACSQKGITMTNGKINEVNTCYNEIYNAFAAVNSTGFYSLPFNRFTDCRQCLVSNMGQMGTNGCNLRIYATPTWNQVSHFFPFRLQENGGNVKQACTQCMNDCQATRYPLACQKQCVLDASAVLKLG